ncbi:MAG: TIGR04282 family arsenosugar biosynthesis glycosyltransferase [Planctomycetes bacterium]|nr:TIGR04282 family arsenosugar biosynthesis glycosyltransferase [Planctomycetota bacterium]
MRRRGEPSRLPSTPPDTLLVFARYPEAGKVKTRLARDLGVRRALAVYRSLLRRTLDLAIARDTAGQRVRIRVAPARRLESFRSGPGRRLPCLAQSGGDLGNRLRRAFEHAWREGSRRIVVIGSDCPGLTARHLDRAFRELRAADAVLGPARDGGYYLLGLSRPAGRVFDRIPWSTDRVLATTLARMRRLRLTHRLLGTLRDVDTAADLP